MSDLTQQQQTACINKALEQIGFEDIMDMYVKDLGTKKIVVDLSAGTSVYFQVGKDRIDTDNEAGTLAGIKQVITNARDGRMPTKSEPDMHYSKDMPAEQPDHDEALNPDYEPQDTSLAPLQTTTDIVRPAVSASQAIAAWRDFQDLQKAILEPSDFQKIGNKDFKKKSAWRKFATFFNLNDKIVEETQTPHADNQGWTWKIKVFCQAPNGRTTEGVGMCSTSERNFAHVEHDTYATAHTRAKNRAISDMVAAGEVSAEEVMQS